MDGSQIEQMESYEKDLLLSEERNEFMLSPVPMEKRRPTFSQVMVWVGFGYVVTGLFIGGTLHKIKNSFIYGNMCITHIEFSCV